MKRGLKKKGSSLVAVLVICSIILVTATTMIGVATADVKMRINQSKKLENMYKSDSGIEVVQNILAKDSTIAIEKAKDEAKTYVDGKGAVGETEDSKLYNEINERFKKDFLHYLVDGIGSSNLNVDTSIDKEEDITKGIGTISNSDFKSRLIYSILSGSYIAESNATSTKFENAFKNITKPEITIVSADYIASEKKISLVIRSKFEDSSAATSSVKVPNKKEIEVRFEIIAPEYSEIINRNNVIGAEQISSPYSNVIAADGNLYIDSTTEASGDIWIKGDANSAREKNPGYAFSKYNGGVIIASGKNFTTSTYDIGEDTNKNSNIYTANTFTMTNKSTVELSGNIYSGNTYIGPTKAGDSLSSEKSVLTLKDMTTYNDLAVNSLGAKITIDNYYGVNYGNNDNDAKSRKSSCILVNNYNSDSELTIKDKAYIMGVAYIATGNSEDGAYETGESVAVKGNYKVYQEVLPGYENKVTLKYYDPEHLVYSIDGAKEASVDQKKDYFNEYYKKEKLGKYKDGGISIGTIYSTGAYVSKNETKEEKSELSVKSEVTNKQNEYARKVFAMNTNVQAPYSKGEVEVTVSGKNNIVKFDEIKNSVVSKSNPNMNMVSSSTDAWRYVLSKNPDETVVIGKDKISILDKEGNVVKYEIKDKDGNPNEYVAEYKNKNLGNVEAVIIAKGNVVLESGVNFTGSILAGGDVTAEAGSNTTKINYDAQLVAQIINSNNLSQYIDTTNAISVGTVNVNKGDKLSIDSSESNGYNVLDVVKKGLWKQIK